MSRVYIYFKCSACGKTGDEFSCDSSWFAKRDYVSIMREKGWKITKGQDCLCKDCHQESIIDNRTVGQQIEYKRNQKNFNKE